ncbi:MAG TPA: M23 family metallopeptidase [Actinomycetota bacterium]|jgi:murein DD-endopeptidase MepM/ murein hydrolase activator NlpD
MVFRALALPLVAALIGSGPVSVPVAHGHMIPASGTWAWPVHGPVIRGFDPPDTPFGAGHRGIDVAVPLGTPVTAPAPGTVSFAGPVGGHLFVTIDHGGGLESTYSWLGTVLVRRGDAVAAGAIVASTGNGHPGSSVPHLHLGVRLDDVYVDPFGVLGPLGVQELIRLAPLAA